MRHALALFFALMGLGCLGLGAYIGVVGVERPLPEGEGTLEGRVVEGATTRSPAGEDFVYARVRIRSASKEGAALTHIDRSFGDPRVRVQTAEGVRALVVGSPDDWRVTSDHDDSVVVEALADAPSLTADDASGIAGTIPPPYEITVRALRVGDHVAAEVRDGRAVRLAVGEPEALAADGSKRDAGRLPVVGLLLVMGLASLGVAYRARP
jgi:hypothetical protein